MPIRERYMRDGLPVRLGGLAANLSRIKSFASREGNREAVESLIDESKYFIEWTAAEAEVDTAAELVELQVQLARWQRNWARIWPIPRNVVRWLSSRARGQGACWRCRGC